MKTEPVTVGADATVKAGQVPLPPLYSSDRLDFLVEIQSIFDTVSL